jgi:hypothetical protein
MGVVCKAEDTRLKNAVALKLLPKGAVERPICAREIRARGTGSLRTESPQNLHHPRHQGMPLGGSWAPGPRVAGSNPARRNPPRLQRLTASRLRSWAAEGVGIQIVMPEAGSSSHQCPSLSPFLTLLKPPASVFLFGCGVRINAWHRCRCTRLHLCSMPPRACFCREINLGSQL